MCRKKMIMEKNIFEINEITCFAYGKKNPQYLLIQPVNEPHAQMLDQQIRFMTEHTEKRFLLVSFLVKDWNQDLSPWCAPAVFRKEDFGKGAGETLAFIEKMLIPEIGRRYGLEKNIKDIPVILGGYSLAGLFALWSAYQESCAVKFAAAAGMSPSVWFPGWLEYMKTKQIQTKRVYLSLGDREERTRNAAMRQVGQNIREMDSCYKNSEKIECVLEWNKGNHFQDVDVRCGKGFLWCMGENICKVNNCKTNRDRTMV